MGWFQKKFELHGVVVFRGTMPPRFEEYAELAKHGFKLTRQANQADAAWVATVEHAKLGTALVIAPKRYNPPPEIIVRMDRYLTRAEEDEILAAGSCVMIRAEATKGHLLRDRKRFFFLARALMGQEGLALLDATSQRFWSRDALRDELAHDADVDISALYNLHTVGDDQGKAAWLHSHGLAPLGFFEFNILYPSADLGGTAQDLLRAIAFLIVEGNGTLDGASAPLAKPRGNVRFVNASAFRAKASPKDAGAWLEMVDDDHLDKNAILCDPGARGLGRLFGDRPRPSRFLSGEIGEEDLIQFSTEAGLLSSERARKTYKVFRSMVEEFRPFELPVLAKIGYVTDGGEPDSKEHMWFEVHRCLDDKLDATLRSTPFSIARMKEGDRGEHGLELMTDWTILTPFGPITPRSLSVARQIRDNADELREALRQVRAERA